MNRPTALLLAPHALLMACGDTAPPAAHGTHEVPSYVDQSVPESSLPLVSLAPEAVARLAIATVPVSVETVAQVRQVAGEVVVPSGATLTLQTPTDAIITLEPGLEPGRAVVADQPLARVRLVQLASIDREAEATADRDAELARTRLAHAEQQLTRARALAAQEAGSERDVEDALAARDLAQVELDAADQRRRALRRSTLHTDAALTLSAPSDGVVQDLWVADGQSVTAGTPLLSIADTATLWVRVPLHSLDLHRVAGAQLSVRPLGSTTPATPVFLTDAPPQAPRADGTVDRYYSLGTASATYLVGERVQIEVPLSEVAPHPTVPASAILYDAHGGEWVYTEVAPHTYRRARVEVRWFAGDTAVLGRGPDAGTLVVTVGAAEVFGAEFAPGH